VFFLEDVKFQRSEGYCGDAVMLHCRNGGGSRVYPEDQQMNGNSISSLNHPIHEGENPAAGQRNRAPRHPGFIERVFDLVQSVLQKHEIAGHYDSCPK
jgi:hypothetical protein